MTFDEWAKEHELNIEKTEYGNYNYIGTGDFFECWKASRREALTQAASLARATEPPIAEDSSVEHAALAIERLRDNLPQEKWVRWKE